MQANTRRQSEVFSIIVEYIKKHGHRPSYAIIARQLGLRSRAGIARIVRDLESQGLLTRRHENGHFHLDIGNAVDAHVPMGGVLIEWLDVPRLTVSQPAWQSSPFYLPEFLIGGQSANNIRAYRITDQSMAAEGLFEDDIALVELRHFVRDGDTVVATLDRGLTVLRRYYRSGSDIELRPAEFADRDTIRLPADRVEIRAILRGSLRSIA